MRKIEFKIIIASLFIILNSCSPNHDNDLKSEICEGDVYLYSQKDIDEFGNQSCSEIIGSLYIEDSEDNVFDITNLNALNSLKIVSNTVNIGVNPLLEQLNGLNKITFIGFNLQIASNEVALNDNSFNNLYEVGGSVYIVGENMTEMNGLNNLKKIGENLNIVQASKLVKIDGLNSLEEIGGNIAK